MRSLWIFGLLTISLLQTHGLDMFPQNFVAVPLPGNPSDLVELTCHAASDGPVAWTFNGEDIDDVEFSDSVQQRGLSLALSEVDGLMLGEYGCWRGGEMLSSTHLLQEADNREDLDSFLTCRAKSYDCNFSCDWKREGVVRLGLGPECRDGGESCRWVNGTRQSGGFRFVLSHSLQPHAEESTMMELTAEAIVNRNLLRGTRRFYLRDIIQPDSPHIMVCQEEGQHLNVTIEPPSTWSTPHSFFSLEHQIEYEFKDDGKMEISSSTLVPVGINRLRARCRDSLVPSDWSDWTGWKNVNSRCLEPARFA